MGERKLKFIQVGAGGFGVFWLELFIPEVKDFAECVAVVDVSESALENALTYGAVPVTVNQKSLLFGQQNSLVFV